MLTIHTATSAASVKNYFEMADYYSEGQETVGMWGGHLTDRLGLFGTVDKASFDLLCDNKNPASGKPLTPRTNEGRRVGYDFVFSGPKSFSVLEALAGESDRQALLWAFNVAVRETMNEVQTDMQVRVRKGGALHDRPTGNMVWAEFDHSTARPVDGGVPDPHRHRHVFAFNATYDPVEKRIKAGEFSYLKRDGEYYTAAFYSRLAGKLEGLGYGIDRLGGKKWEIAGVPRAVIDRFSKRTLEVESEADRLGLAGGKLKAGLGAKTRSRKQKELTPAELRDAWFAQLSGDDRDALAAVYRRGWPAAEPVAAKDAVAYAIAHASERLSVMPERELKRLALLYGLGSLTIDQVNAELPRQGVITEMMDGRVMATTPELQREEDAIIGFAACGLGAVQPIGLAGRLERGRLNDGQWDAACGLLKSENRVGLVVGPAGAGKSSLLAAYQEGASLAGETITFLASSSDAVEVLAKDGFADARTVAHFLLDEKMQAAASGGRVVIDEASMLGHKDAVRLIEVAKKHDLKLIFVGDPMQHGSVPRGSLLRILTDYAGVRPFKLTQIMRQKHAGYLEAAKLLSEGRPLSGFDALDSLGWVREVEGDAERCGQLAGEYVQARCDGKTVLVVSPTHREAGQITDAIRSGLRVAGMLGDKEHGFTRLVPVNASEAERGQATSYRTGDVLQFHQNARGGIKKGDRLMVGDPAAVPLAEAAKFSLYRPAAINVAEGDVLRFTGTVKTLDAKHTLKNGASRSVAAITPGGNIRLDNGWIVGKEAGHFRHGFVETSFGSQGRTVDRVILGMSAASSGAMNQEQMYVSASRGRERLSLYTDDKDAVRQAIRRSTQKLAAVDLRPKPPAGVKSAGAKLEAWHRWQDERKRRRSFIGRIRSALPLARGPLRPKPPAGAMHSERVKARQDKEHRNER